MRKLRRYAVRFDIHGPIVPRSRITAYIRTETIYVYAYTKRDAEQTARREVKDRRPANTYSYWISTERTPDPASTEA